ncbi:hypothetical protein C8R46DRAFT_1081667, partial [Mycena filopes]
MHPSLRLANLYKLPFSTKQLAVAVASSQRTFDDVYALFQAVPLLPENLQPFVLPAFYASLDPAKIPAILDSLDSATSPDDVEAIGLRMVQIDISLSSIAIMMSIQHIPEAAFPELWPRIWQWIEFRHTYEEHLPDLSSLSRSRYAVDMEILRWTVRSEPAAALMWATPHLCTVVARAWAHLIHEPDDEGFDDCCKYLGYWIITSRTWGTEVFEDLLLGVGGTRRDLAAVLMLHMKRAVPSRDSEITGNTLVHLLVVVYMVRKIMGERWDEAFRDILLAQGIIAALTTICWALGLSTHPTAMIEVKGLLDGLVSSLLSPVHITEALEAGLLHAVLACSPSHHEEATGEIVIELLRDNLPGSTCYHSVLSRLSLSLPDVCVLETPEMMANPVVLENWQRFLILAEERLAVMRAYDTGSLTSPRTCANLICPNLEDALNYKCCSDCRVVYYCSYECQVNDWRHGGHRRSCKTLAARRRDTAHINAKDRAFLRVLVNHDYATQQPALALAELQWMHAHPSEIPYILFDYTDGQMEPSFESHHDAPAAFATEIIAAANRTGGRRLHLMTVLDGEDSVDWIVPLVGESLTLRWELRMLADSIPPDTDWEEIGPTYMEKIRNLMVQGGAY